MTNRYALPKNGQYTYSKIFNRIYNKTIYYENFVDLSSLGSILQAQDIKNGSVKLSNILDLISRYPNLKEEFGCPTHSDIYICQGYYTYPEVLNLGSNIICL